MAITMKNEMCKMFFAYVQKRFLHMCNKYAPYMLKHIGAFFAYARRLKRCKKVFA